MNRELKYLTQYELRQFLTNVLLHLDYLFHRFRNFCALILGVELPRGLEDTLGKLASLQTTFLLTIYFCLQMCCHGNNTKFLIQILITSRDSYYTFDIL
ncbi:GSCOCG00005332001-RA-CDS [Cotesia congregata]|nr:GSCOCG00005332001-RA-CDS [Cotesia congregata]